MSYRLLLCLAIAFCGCSQRVIVKSDSPDTQMMVMLERAQPEVENEEVQDEASPEEKPSFQKIEIERTGTQVDIPAGIDDVPIRVFQGGQVRKGFIPRSRPDPWVIAAVAGVCCCVPSGAIALACVANPASWAALIGAALTSNPGLLFTVSPSACTPFALTLGGALGLTPGIAGLLGRTPEVVTLHVKEIPLEEQAAKAMPSPVATPETPSTETPSTEQFGERLPTREEATNDPQLY